MTLSTRYCPSSVFPTSSKVSWNGLWFTRSPIVTVAHAPSKWEPRQASVRMAFSLSMRMRKLVAAVALVVLASGCKHPGSAKLEGRWRGMKADGVPADQQINGNVFATATEIIAKGDQIAVTTPVGKPVQGT